ncbi:MAG: hypothetical protein D6728_12290 [Cyanobacteria bacterium J055]|nr:MAG: hypothetical protein D6728_12290 [Cyanobacteria bacterium J055]
MESGSPSGSPSAGNPHTIAQLVGTLIALLTLTMPLFVIARYSASNTNLFPPSGYPATPIRSVR